MTIGLLRWPTIEWTLALYWESALPPSRVALSALFDASNLYLGNVFGEFVGEMSTALWFIALAIAFRRAGRPIVGHLGAAAGLLVMVAAFRNITTAALDPDWQPSLPARERQFRLRDLLMPA